MHVREVPKLIFNELVQEPRTIILKQYFNEKYPDSIIAKQYNERSHDQRLLGETSEGCWLWLAEEGPSVTSLSVHGSLEGLLTDEFGDEFGRLVAGKRVTGTWALGSGHQYDQTLWIKTSHETFAGTKKLLQSSAAFGLLGNIALRTHQMIESGQVDVSRFFESDIDLGAQTRPGTSIGQTLHRAIEGALNDLDQ